MRYPHGRRTPSQRPSPSRPRSLRFSCASSSAHRSERRRTFPPAALRLAPRLTHEPIARSHVGVGSALQHVAHAQPWEQQPSWPQERRPHDLQPIVECCHRDRPTHAECVHRPAALEEHAVSGSEPANIARSSHAFAAGLGLLDRPLASPGSPKDRSSHGRDASGTYRHRMPASVRWSACQHMLRATRRGPRCRCPRRALRRCGSRPATACELLADVRDYSRRTGRTLASRSRRTSRP